MKRYLLKEIMKDRGYNGASLALALGMHQGTLSRKIQERSPFSLSEWTALKDLLKIDPELERELLS